MIKDSKEHLKEVNETYIQHLIEALKIGFTMIFGGFQAIIHAIIPGILKKSTKLFGKHHKNQLLIWLLIELHLLIKHNQ